MKNFKVIALLAGFVAFIFTGQVRSDEEDELRKAYNSLPGTMKTAFDALGGEYSLIDELIEAKKCIAKEAGPFDVCNFKTSFDPFYYIQKCANGTGLQTFIENTIGRIPQLEVPLGVPLAISKDRCYTGIPPLPLPFTLPPVTTPPITVPSITPLVTPGITGLPVL